MTKSHCGVWFFTALVTAAACSENQTARDAAVETDLASANDLPSANDLAIAGDLASSADAATSAVTRPSYNTGVGFFVGLDHKLYDANGHRFTMRGVNRLHYDSGSANAIAMSGANAVRWVLYWDNGTTAAQFVTQLTQENHDKQIVAIPGVWTTSNAFGHATLTCDSSTANLTHAVDQWVAQVDDWKTIERWSIINIANEWGPSDSTTWRDAYIDAIGRMRDAGYRHTLLIDAGGCGQDTADLIQYGKAVFDSDPERNVVFAIHIYGNTMAGEANTVLGALAATGLPIVIGEFGPGRNIGPSPTDLTPGELIGAANALEMGWLAWAWDDNNLSNGMANDDWFALVYDSNASQATSTTLTQFGDDVVLNASYGLQATAVRATVFP